VADSTLDITATTPGFSDAVTAAQKMFRLALEAMAHPGRIVETPPDLLPTNQSGLSDAMAALALTLLDFETPVWLDHALAQARGFLRFHCSAPIVATPNSSRFAFAADLAALPALDEFDLGTAEYPDRSTTLILEVADLAAGIGLNLRGPGIAETTGLLVRGPAPGFWRERQALAPHFPLGLDLFLTSGRRLAALPRTATVEA